MRQYVLLLLSLGLMGLYGCTAGLQRTAPEVSRPAPAPQVPRAIDYSTAAGATPSPFPQALRVTKPAIDSDLFVVRPGAGERSHGIWQRIVTGYGFPDTKPSRLQTQIRRYTRHPRRFRRIAERAKPYLYYILDRIEARGLPAELALLPIVESGYKPFAASVRDAVGLWQIMPATGQHLGLTQNWWFDGRRDLPTATRAALDYLAYQAAVFDHDWLLAIAAYNAGEGTVRRAIRRNAAAGRPTDFWHLRLPAETERYVPRLLAVRELVAAPGAHGITLPEIPDERAIELVEIDGQIELATAAELANIKLARLKRLNAGYRRWATGPSGPSRLLVPSSHAEALREGLAALPAQAWIRWRRYRVQRGDTLSEIAQHYDLPTALLRRANGLSSSVIRVGQTLRIPLDPNDSPTLASSGGAGLTAYTVRRGDSLYAIAQRFGTTVKALRRWNDINEGNYLQPGQELTLRPGNGLGASADPG